MSGPHRGGTRMLFDECAGPDPVIIKHTIAMSDRSNSVVSPQITLNETKGSANIVCRKALNSSTGTIPCCEDSAGTVGHRISQTVNSNLLVLHLGVWASCRGPDPRRLARRDGRRPEDGTQRRSATKWKNITILRQGQIKIMTVLQGAARCCEVLVPVDYGEIAILHIIQ